MWWFAYISIAWCASLFVCWLSWIGPPPLKSSDKPQRSKSDPPLPVQAIGPTAVAGAGAGSAPDAAPPRTGAQSVVIGFEHAAEDESLAGGTQTKQQIAAEEAKALAVEHPARLHHHHPNTPHQPATTAVVVRPLPVPVDHTQPTSAGKDRLKPPAPALPGMAEGSIQFPSVLTDARSKHGIEPQPAPAIESAGSSQVPSDRHSPPVYLSPSAAAGAGVRAVKPHQFGALQPITAPESILLPPPAAKRMAPIKQPPQEGMAGPPS